MLEENNDNQEYVNAIRTVIFERRDELVGRVEGGYEQVNAMDSKCVIVPSDVVFRIKSLEAENAKMRELLLRMADNVHCSSLYEYVGDMEEVLGIKTFGGV